MRNHLLFKAILTTFILTFLVEFSGSVMAQSTTVFLNADGSQVAGAWVNDTRLNTLVKDLHPSIYLSEGLVKVREKSATNLFTDVASLATVRDLSFASGQIEVVTITVDEASQLSSFLDLAPFEGYGLLKYVHVKASIECQTGQLFAMLKNISSNYRILITVEVPS